MTIELQDLFVKMESTHVSIPKSYVKAWVTWKKIDNPNQLYFIIQRSKNVEESFNIELLYGIVKHLSSKLIDYKDLLKTIEKELSEKMVKESLSKMELLRTYLFITY